MLQGRAAFHCFLGMPQLRICHWPATRLTVRSSLPQLQKQFHKEQSFVGKTLIDLNYNRLEVWGPLRAPTSSYNRWIANNLTLQETRNI